MQDEEERERSGSIEEGRSPSATPTVNAGQADTEKRQMQLPTPNPTQSQTQTQRAPPPSDTSKAPSNVTSPFQHQSPSQILPEEEVIGPIQGAVDAEEDDQEERPLPVHPAGSYDEDEIASDSDDYVDDDDDAGGADVDVDAVFEGRYNNDDNW
jgi:hypothetical protein